MEETPESSATDPVTTTESKKEEVSTKYTYNDITATSYCATLRISRPR